jgi:hypothetical protein
MRFAGRQVDHRGLLQPANERAKDLWQPCTVWPSLAGANEATTFVTTSDLMIGGKRVPAGSYTLFTIPDKNKWTLIISKNTGEWGIPYPEGHDLLRVDMNSGPTSGLVQGFTTAFDKGSNGCTLRMEWENTRANVDIATM